MNDTELRLANWRDGSTQAERLAAALLALTGYEQIDPQHPLGGPDDKKDIICKKGGLTWVGAVYFPNAQLRFTSTKTKFKHDLGGLSPEHRGIAFVTNQSLTVGQRKSLTDIAEDAGKEADILHLERLRALLDTPSGFGTRIQFLRIPMTLDDQLSWFADSGNRVAAAVTTNTRELLALKAMVERLSHGQKEIFRTMQVAGFPGPAALATPDLLSASSFTKDSGSPTITSELTAGLVLLFHRLICFDLPTKTVGRYRTREIALSASDGTKATHIQPSPARDIAKRLSDLCDEWRGGFGKIRRESVEGRLEALASFHARFLVIHPFLDGNGRVARGLLMQQCLDLFDRADMSLMDKGAAYYRALASADGGQLRALQDVIRPIVEG